MGDAKMIILRLPPVLVRRLDTLAKKQSSSRNEFYKQILSEYLERRKDEKVRKSTVQSTADSFFGDLSLSSSK